MLVNILSVFRFAHGGVRVVEYRPASAVDLPADVADEALREGWAEPYQPAPSPEVEAESKAKPKHRRRR